MSVVSYSGNESGGISFSGEKMSINAAVMGRLHHVLDHGFWYTYFALVYKFVLNYFKVRHESG